MDDLSPVLSWLEVDGSSFENITSGDSTETTSLANLFPALVQIFLTILVGYIAGYANIITTEQANGLNIFVGKFSLPVMLFMSLFKLDFSTIDWAFLLAVLATKVVIFFGVVLIDYLSSKPRNSGRAAMFGIFCTQSNDFGMGLPILYAVYGTDNIFVNYLYLVAPISLLFLNPIGFLLMEVSKSEKQGSWKETLSKVFSGILTNPVVFMTFLGIVCNFIFSHKIPDVFENFLQSLANAFTATAPFCLGLSLVGNSGFFKAKGLVPIFWIVVIKSLVSAIFNRTFVYFLYQVMPAANGTSSIEIENFAFLYGTFPTANGVFVYASQYEIIPDIIAGAIIIGTVVSAPIMYVSASILTIMEVNRREMFEKLQVFDFEVAVVSVICNCLLLVVFILRKKLYSILHKLTVILVLHNLVQCISVFIAYSYVDNWEQMALVTLYTQACGFTFGIYGARLTSASLAIAMWLCSRNHLKIVEKFHFLFILAGPVLAAIAVTTLALVAPKKPYPGSDAEFQFGNIEGPFTMSVIAVSLVITVLCLVTMKNGDGTKREVDNGSKRSSKGSLNMTGFDTDKALDMPSRDKPDISHNETESIPNANNSTTVLRKIKATDIQLVRHKFLLLLLILALVFGLVLTIWTTQAWEGNDNFTGVYKVIIYLDNFLNIGQGILVFLVFGLDSGLTSYMKKLLSKLKLLMKRGKLESHWMN